MKNYNRKRRPPRTKPVVNIIVNPNCSGYSEKDVEYLIDELEHNNILYFPAKPETPEDTTRYVKNVLNKRPTGIIVCGGDGTVNRVARHVIRRKTILGILPMGRFNNIYRSLYGEPDIKTAVDIILAGREKKIDYGIASGHFFLGSAALGLIPELAELLSKKRSPMFSIGWSRLAAQAAASVRLRERSIKVDAFEFHLSPQTLNINLLPYSAGLPLTPMSLADDGKCEIVFDIGEQKAIMSSFIRLIQKRKYVYSNEVRMFRGQRISVTPVDGSLFYIDGELIKLSSSELTVEIMDKKIRVYDKTGK